MRLLSFITRYFRGANVPTVGGTLVYKEGVGGRYTIISSKNGVGFGGLFGAFGNFIFVYQVRPTLASKGVGLYKVPDGFLYFFGGDATTRVFVLEYGVLRF